MLGSLPGQTFYHIHHTSVGCGFCGGDRSGIPCYVSIFRTLDICKLCLLDVFSVTHTIGFRRLLWNFYSLSYPWVIFCYQFLALHLCYHPLVLWEIGPVIHRLQSLVLTFVLQPDLVVCQLVQIVWTEYEFGLFALW